MDRSIFACLKCGEPVNPPTECFCTGCHPNTKSNSKEKEQIMTEQKIPTTDKEAKAYFKDIAICGYTYKDYREFIGTLSGVNTKKMKPLELYHLKIKLDNALRQKNTKPSTMEQRMHQAEHDITQLIKHTEEQGEFIISLQQSLITANCRVDHLNRKINKLLGHGSVDYPDEETPAKGSLTIGGASTIEVAGNDGVFKPVELKHNGIVGWFKRTFKFSLLQWFCIITTIVLFLLMWTDFAKIFVWLPNLLGFIGGCA